jgi:N utilization substance protein B
MSIDHPLTAPATPAKPSQKLRRASRLAAVQALYEMLLVGQNQPAAIAYRLAEGTPLDQEFLQLLLEQSFANASALDDWLIPQLSENWSWDRVPLVLQIILRLGLCELLLDITPPRVVINEYVNLTKRFFEADEPKFVNALLDGCYKQQQPV